jgi:hypothetical protein
LDWHGRGGGGEEYYLGGLVRRGQLFQTELNRIDSFWFPVPNAQENRNHVKTLWHEKIQNVWGGGGGNTGSKFGQRELVSECFNTNKLPNLNELLYATNLLVN